MFLVRVLKGKDYSLWSAYVERLKARPAFERAAERVVKADGGNEDNYA